jgi:hypothetical protein
MNVYVFQGLPSTSAEFHLAASSTFLTILEKKLVHPRTFTQTFLQGILSSIDSRDPGTDKLLLYIYTYMYISSLHLYSISITDLDTGFLFIRNAVVFVFMLAALLFCPASLCMVSVLLFLPRFDVARSVPLSLPCC